MRNFNIKNKIGYILFSILLTIPFYNVVGQESVIDSTTFQTMEYRMVGPYRGGRSTAIAGHADRINEYYFGATGGGLWKTTDGGLNWDPVTDGQLNASSVGAVDVADSNPDIVYIGMGESEFRGILCREMVFTNLLTLVKLGKILVLKIPKLFLALEYILPILTLSMFLYLAILLVQMRSVEFLKLLMEGNHGIKYCIKDLRLVLQI